MKKLISILLVCAMLFGLAACSKGGENVQPPTKAEQSMARYMDFLEGKEAVFKSENYDWYKEYYNEFEDLYETELVLGTEAGFLIDDVLYNLLDSDEFLSVNDKISSVKYAFIDCGNDGEPELALQVVAYDNYGDPNNFELVIKDNDGVLELCYICYSYYRSMEFIANKYGVILSQGSNSAFSSSGDYGYINKDGKYEIIYTYFDSFDFIDDPGFFGPEFDELTEEDLAEINENGCQFGEYAIMKDNSSEVYYCYYPCDEAAVNVFKKIGIDIKSYDDIDAILLKAKQDAGLTEEVYDNYDYPDFKDVDTKIVQEYLTYGYHPVYVSSVEEFVDAIDNYTTIVLAPGNYNFTDYLNDAVANNKLEFGDLYEGVELPGVYIMDNYDYNLGLFYLEGLKNCSADPKNPAEIEVTSADNHVLDFAGCVNMAIENVKMGHDAMAYGCSAEVLGLYGCDGFYIVDSDLYGCGTYGIIADYGTGIIVKGTKIHDCSDGGIIFTCVQYSSFEDCQFVDIYGRYTIANFDSTIDFSNCQFKNCGSDFLYMDSENAMTYFDGSCTYDQAVMQALQNFEGSGFLYY